MRSMYARATMRWLHATRHAGVARPNQRRTQATQSCKKACRLVKLTNADAIAGASWPAEDPSMAANFEQRATAPKEPPLRVLQLCTRAGNPHPVTPLHKNRASNIGALGVEETVLLSTFRHRSTAKYETKQLYRI